MIPLDTPLPLAWIHNQFVPQNEAVLNLHDAGFVMGATVTDMSRTFSHKLFLLEEHIRRFISNCESCCINIKSNEIELRKIAEELVHKNSLQIESKDDLALVMFATPGPIAFYLGGQGGAGDGTPTLGMHTFKLPLKRYRSWIENGVELQTVSVRQPSPQSINPMIKQRSRMHWYLADREAKKISANAQAILLDENGFLTETAAANLVIIKDLGGFQLITPRHEKVLDGIALQMIKKFANHSGFPFLEADILPEQVSPNDGAIITGSTFCFASVKSINGTNLNRSAIIMQKLLDFWQKEVNINIHEQILNEY